MNAGKKRPVSHITGEVGVKILKDFFPQSWVVREYSPDYGIDLSVELFDSYEDGYITKGEHIFFQVKGTENLSKDIIKVHPRYNVEKAYRRSNGEIREIEVVKYSLDTSLLATVEAMGSAVPVMLAVVDVATRVAYFVCLNDYIEKVIVPENQNYTKQSQVTIYIPTANQVDGDGVRIIEWYAKRAKLYALFNKISYQKGELDYCLPHELEEQTRHFLNILYRSDAWSAVDYFGAMQIVKQEIDFFLEHGITQGAARIIEDQIQSGEDVDEESWEATYCPGLVSLRTANRVQGLHHLWEKMAIMGDMFEDVTKEAFLPTSLGISISK